MPIRHIALSFARLVCPDEQEFDESIVKACARVIQAMSDFPEMVGAIQHRLDTDLMTVAKGKLIAKVGAEGVYTVGMLPCEQYPMGLGVALKIEDGDDRRIRGIVAVEALKQLDVLTESDLTKLSEYRERLLKNHRGDIVGHVRAKFQLEMNPGL
jgi:L-asparaginase II